MENKEAPIPETIDFINNEKKYFISKDNNRYILTCLIENNYLILKLKSDSKTTDFYYEVKFNKDDLLKISNIFSICSDIEESFTVIVDHLDKNKKELNLDFSDKDVAKLLFFIELPTRKKEYTHIDMIKKFERNSNNINEEDINQIKSKIESIQENQKEFIGKFEQIESIISCHKYLENELKLETKDIEDIKILKNKFEKFMKDNESKIKEIEENQKNILLDIESIKKKEIRNNINSDSKAINKINDLEKRIENIKESQNGYDKIFNNKEEEMDILTEKILKYENTLENTKKEINIIKENQDKLEEEFKNNNKEKLTGNNTINKIMEEIELLKKENEIMKKQIISNDKKLADFSKILKNNLSEIKDAKINPGDFKFKKTISSDLFTLNFYNNRACIFTYSQDDNIYVAYGVTITFNLECYDVLNDKKFIIIKKLHKDSFDSCRFYYDKGKKRDLLITSSHDSHVKVVKFKKEESEIILDLNFESIKDAIINTAYFVYETILIPFSREKILKFYTMNSEYIGELENTGFILGLSTYFWAKEEKNFAFIANTIGIFVYLIDGFCLYCKFIPPEEKEEDKEEKNNGFDEPYIIERDEKLILVGPCFYYGYLYFWDFKTKTLIHKLETDSGISDICLWNNTYIFASLHGSKFQFELINCATKKIEKKFIKGIQNFGCGIKILRHETKGDFLITFSIKGNLDIYVIENKKTPF